MYNRKNINQQKTGVVFNCFSCNIFNILIVMCLFFLSGIFPVYTKGAEAILSEQEIEELAPMVEAAEQKLQDIKIDSELWVEEKTDLSDPCQPWQRTPVYVSSSALFSGDWSMQKEIESKRDSKVQVNDGKSRIEILKQILKWHEGAEPYSQTSLSFGFDGQYGKSIIHTTGSRNNQIPIKQATILSGAPNEFLGWYGRFTGIDFSLHFFLKDKDYSFSDLFKGYKDPNTMVSSYFTFAIEEYNEISCIKIILKWKGHRECWWLDPNRGFALLGYKEIYILESGKEKLRRSLEITQLKEISDGLWWPIEAYYITMPTESGQPWKRLVYRATNVKGNDSALSDSDFDLKIPKGYKVKDTINKKEYINGEEDT